MTTCAIREVCGDWALDIDFSSYTTMTIYFNSRTNAESVRRIIEIDASMPNAATVCDMVQVVRCRNCKHYRKYMERDMCAKNATLLCGSEVGLRATEKNNYCGYGEPKRTDGDSGG